MALCSSSGSIDWLCLPRFDSPPVFGALLGGEEAGSFLMGPAPALPPRRRRYLPGSTITETTWPTPGGELVLTEGLVAQVAGRLLLATLLVRRVECRGSPAAVRMHSDPRLGWGRSSPRAQRRGPALVCTSGRLALSLQMAPDPGVEPGRPARLTLEPGRALTAAMAVADGEPLVHVEPEDAWTALGATDQWWRRWADDLDDDGPFATRSCAASSLCACSRTRPPARQ